MTQAIEDIDLTILIDFESDLTCEWNKSNPSNMPRCDKPAEWIMWFIPCACHRALVCTEHKNIRLKVDVSVHTCIRCGIPIQSMGVLPV